MTDEQKAAYVFSQAVCALCEMEAMKALNAYRLQRGESQGYPEEAFTGLIEQYNIHHNAVMKTFGDKP